MSAVDQLLRLLVEGTRNISRRMAAVGYGEDPVRDAWDGARRQGSPRRQGWDRIG